MRHLFKRYPSTSKEALACVTGGLVLVASCIVIGFVTGWTVKMVLPIVGIVALSVVVFFVVMLPTIKYTFKFERSLFYYGYGFYESRMFKERNRIYLKPSSEDSGTWN